MNERKRGGLLTQYYDVPDNVLQRLIRATSTYSSKNDYTKDILSVLIRLRRVNLFRKEDVREYELVHIACFGFYTDHVTDQTITFFVEWNPASLLQLSRVQESTPLEIVARSSQSLANFRTVFELGIRYFPSKIGIPLLFKKRAGAVKTSKIALQIACEEYKRDDVMNMVEEIITASNSSTTPIHLIDAILLAAIDDSIHLDGVYLLLRRQPDGVLSQLRQQSGLSANDVENEDGKRNHGRDTDENGIYVANQEAGDNTDTDNDRYGLDNKKATIDDKRKRKRSTVRIV